MNRDPATYREASEGPKNAIDELPAIIREIIAENWTKELPRTESGFIRQCSQLAAVALVALIREGRLDAIAEGIGGTDNDVAKFIVTEIIYAPNPRLTAQCCDIVFGLKITGASEQQLSDAHGMTRANVSNICTSLKDCYTGKPGPGMKSNEAVKKYRAKRIGKRSKDGGDWQFQKRFQKAFKL